MAQSVMFVLPTSRVKTARVTLEAHSAEREFSLTLGLSRDSGVICRSPLLCRALRKAALVEWQSSINPQSTAKSE